MCFYLTILINRTMIKRIVRTINEFFNTKRYGKWIKKLSKYSFSIISSDCLGGVLYHDLHKTFLSPTINTSFGFDDFYRFCSDLDYCIKQDLVFCKSNKHYPVGSLLDSNGNIIKIEFVHYSDAASAENKWKIRSERIDADNVFVVIDKVLIEPSDIEMLDKLKEKGFHIFVFCYKNASSAQREYIHHSSFLKHSGKKKGQFVTYRFVFGSRHFNKKLVYKYILSTLEASNQ